MASAPASQADTFGNLGDAGRAKAVPKGRTPLGTRTAVAWAKEQPGGPASAAEVLEASHAFKPSHFTAAAKARASVRTPLGIAASAHPAAALQAALGCIYKNLLDCLP